MHQNIKNLKCIHTLYCGTAEWQNIFNAKISNTKLYLLQKFSYLQYIFIAATTESFADANKMNTKIPQISHRKLLRIAKFANVFFP